MPKEIVVPRLGWSMEEGVFSEWLKRAGEWVRAGDMLFVLEGEKAAQEIESFDAGMLCVPPDAPQRGELVRVGQVIGFLLTSDEPAPSSVRPAGQPHLSQPGNSSEPVAQPATPPTTRVLDGTAPSPVASVGRVAGEGMAQGTPPAGTNSPRIAADAMSTHQSLQRPVPKVAFKQIDVPIARGVSGSDAEEVRTTSQPPAALPSALPTALSNAAGSALSGAPSAAWTTMEATTVDFVERIAGPAARRLARELGLDRNRVVTPDPTGRVRTEDLRQAASSPSGGRPTTLDSMPGLASSVSADPLPAERLPAERTHAERTRLDSRFIATTSVAEGERSHPRQAAPLAAVIHPASATRPRSTPRARRRAAALGIDWRKLTGSGHQGRIREQDVLVAYEQLASSEAKSNRAAEPVPATAGIHRTASKLRLALAQRMQAGLRQAAPVTLHTKVDAGTLVELRERWKRASAGERVPSYNDILIKLVAIALRERPELNACWYQDGVWTYTAIHIATAVDTNLGLLAPVIRDADQCTVKQIAERTQQLVQQARAGRLTQAQLEGGTFTVTNLGMFGIDSFTPVLNLPQAGILGVGRVVAEPVVRQGRIEAGQTLTLSLTFDHRVTDGGPAARWLQRLSELIQQPGCLGDD